MATGSTGGIFFGKYSNEVNPLSANFTKWSNTLKQFEDLIPKSFFKVLIFGKIFPKLLQTSFFQYVLKKGKVSQFFWRGHKSVGDPTEGGIFKMLDEGEVFLSSSVGNPDQ